MQIAITMILCDHVTLGQTSRVNKFVVHMSMRWIKFQVHNILIHPNPSCHPNNVASFFRWYLPIQPSSCCVFYLFEVVKTWLHEPLF